MVSLADVLPDEDKKNKPSKGISLIDVTDEDKKIKKLERFVLFYQA
jgi:hypothetical protein